jgi:hypothetical protein
VLRTSARKEFEGAREERDPEAVARLIITGRDCVMQIHDMVPPHITPDPRADRDRSSMLMFCLLCTGGEEATRAHDRREGAAIHAVTCRAKERRRG